MRACRTRWRVSVPFALGYGTLFVSAGSAPVARVKARKAFTPPLPRLPKGTRVERL